MACRHIPEMNYLMSLVEKKFHKDVKTTTDFNILAGEIESVTCESVSPSTLKRMWGYVNMSPMPRQSTLDVLARYIGKSDYKSFCEDLRNSEALNSAFFTAEFIDSRDLKPGESVDIGWNPDRIVSLKCLGDSKFEVVSSHNSKLMPGDRFSACGFIKGSPLYISRIERDGRLTLSYIAGRQGGLTILRRV